MRYTTAASSRPMMQYVTHACTPQWKKARFMAHCARSSSARREYRLPPSTPRQLPASPANTPFEAHGS